MTHARKLDRRRFLISVGLALIAHVVLFVTVQYLMPLKEEETPDYSGPIEVTITREPRDTVIGSALEEPPVSEKIKTLEEPVREEPLQEEKPLLEQKPEAVEKSTAAPVQRQETGAANKPVTESIKKESLPFFKSAPVTEIPSPAEEKVVSKPENRTVTPDTAETKPERGTVTEEIPKEDINAPAEQDQTLAPEQEKPGKKLPFEPSAELKPDTLTLPMERLDQAIEHEKDGAEPAGAGPVSVPESDTRSVPETSAKNKDVSSSGAPQIEWDEEGLKRTLIFAGPRPDIPDWVKEEGLNLKVAVLFAVTPEGHTTSVRLGESSGYTDVDSAIIEVVRKMRFNPAKVSENVTGTIRYIISPK